MQRGSCNHITLSILIFYTFSSANHTHTHQHSTLINPKDKRSPSDSDLGVSASGSIRHISSPGIVPVRTRVQREDLAVYVADHRRQHLLFLHFALCREETRARLIFPSFSRGRSIAATFSSSSFPCATFFFFASV